MEEVALSKTRKGTKEYKNNKNLWLISNSTTYSLKVWFIVAVSVLEVFAPLSGETEQRIPHSWLWVDKFSGSVVTLPHAQGLFISFLSLLHGIHFCSYIRVHLPSCFELTGLQTYNLKNPKYIQQWFKFLAAICHDLAPSSGKGDSSRVNKNTSVSFSVQIKGGKPTTKWKLRWLLHVVPLSLYLQQSPLYLCSLCAAGLCDCVWLCHRPFGEDLFSLFSEEETPKQRIKYDLFFCFFSNLLLLELSLVYKEPFCYFTLKGSAQ